MTKSSTPKPTVGAILSALSNVGPLDDDALYVATGSRDDYRDAIDDLLEQGKIVTEVNEYLQQDIYSLPDPRC